MPSLTITDAASRMTMADKPKKWIAKAVPKAHEGKFSAKAKAAGKSTQEYAAEKKDAPGALGKEARLAQTFAGMAKGGKKKLSYKNSKYGD